MSIESRAQLRHEAKLRRRLVIAAGIGAFIMMGAVAVAFWPTDGWRDQALSSDLFPGPPGGSWADASTSTDGWGTAAGASPRVPTGTAGAIPTATAVPASAPASQVPTSRALSPSPSSPAVTPSAPTTSTAAPSPTNTRGPKPRHKPKPTPSNKPGPTTSVPTDGCVLLVLC